MVTTPPTARPGHVYVIPCSGMKLDHAAPARELYVGSYHKSCWRAAAALAGDDGLILVLSARHGLVTLDEVLEPYDTRFGDRGAVSTLLLTAQARNLGIEHAREVTVLAGGAYVQAVRKVWPHAKAPLAGLGIGKQLQLLNEMRSPTVEKPKPPAAQPIEAIAEHGPLYHVPDDYSQRERPFTVTVAGTERHDGEKPYTYVVSECSTEKAWAKVLAWFMVDQETVDAHVVAGESFEGEPEPGCGYFWTDLRPEFTRREALNDLADQATEAVDAFHSATASMVRDGDVLADQQSAYDTQLGDAAYAAWPLVLELAANDGRD
ncbi:DUF6884 domain-containing protein [Streptomyces smyrnaeus]|uniref:DUF6884 domain-containing protein n=1 Tax=Streptomyces smyrnaeus TaxID=1387713 RepID=UPI0036845802